MSESNSEKDKFLYPHSSYRGEFTLPNLAFDANLQEFAQRVEYVCALETNGKIAPTEAYDEIKKLYKQLEKSTALLKEDFQPPTDA